MGCGYAEGGVAARREAWRVMRSAGDGLGDTMAR
jgi:hypothetical protein